MLLFNLAKDPEAQHNLADGEEHQERLRRLFRRLLETQKATGHELDLRSFPRNWPSHAGRVTRQAPVRTNPQSLSGHWPVVSR